MRHLFFNTPVRKKFLRTVSTELGHVVEVATRLALAIPNLHVVIRHNGKMVHEVPAAAWGYAGQTQELRFVAGRMKTEWLLRAPKLSSLACSSATTECIACSIKTACEPSGWIRETILCD